MNRLLSVLPVVLIFPLASCTITDSTVTEVNQTPSASQGECHCSVRKRQQVEARMKRKELEAE